MSDCPYLYVMKNNIKYPFEEGDSYWTIEDDNEIIESCWDYISEELYDENPNKKLFSSKQEALDYLTTITR